MTDRAKTQNETGLRFHVVCGDTTIAEAESLYLIRGYARTHSLFGGKEQRVDVVDIENNKIETSFWNGQEMRHV